MILGGTSKSNKSWCLLDLALSVASGREWWGRRLPDSILVNFGQRGLGRTGFWDCVYRQMR